MVFSLSRHHHKFTHEKNMVIFAAARYKAARAGSDFKVQNHETFLPGWNANLICLIGQFWC